jgi:hypothetical protein
MLRDISKRHAAVHGRSAGRSRARGAEPATARDRGASRNASKRADADRCGRAARCRTGALTANRAARAASRNCGQQHSRVPESGASGGAATVVDSASRRRETRECGQACAVVCGGGRGWRRRRFARLQVVRRLPRRPSLRRSQSPSKIDRGWPRDALAQCSRCARCSPRPAPVLVERSPIDLSRGLEVLADLGGLVGSLSTGPQADLDAAEAFR